MKFFENRRINQQLRQAGLQGESLGEGQYFAEIDEKQVQLTHSSFNTSWLEDLGLNPHVIFDLGSFDGGDGLRFQQAFPSCRVISVEADPDRFKIVCQHLKSSNINIVHSAVCDTDGEIDWFSAKIEGGTHGQGSLFKQSKVYKRRYKFVKQSERPIKVPCVRIDTLCQRFDIKKIDLVHMDIEGAELLALKGLGVFRPTYIYLEMRDKLFVGGPASQETKQLLESMNYSQVLNLGPDKLYKSDL
jgi:2-O-methyltransferase